MGKETLLSKNLLALRKAHRKNQDQIAEICCVDRTTISCWERGTRNPNVDSLDILSKFYGIETDVLENREIEASYEASSQTVTIRIVEDLPHTYCNTESTMLVVEGPGFKTLLTNPRMGLEKERAYQIYKRATEIDYAVEIDDDRILDAMDDYWYAYNHGIDEAGVNLLRIYFLIILASHTRNNETITTLEYLINDMKDKGNPSGDYYHALSLMYHVIPSTNGLNSGIQMMKELAQAENEYAMEAITYIEKGRDLWEN